MTIHYQAEQDYLVATSLDLLQSLDVSLQTGSDFDEYRNILVKARPDHSLGVPFDPERHDLNENSACWIVGRDSDGTVMHTQAMKQLSMANLPLSDYLRLHLPDFEPSSLDIDYSRSIYRPGPGAKRMRGKIVYHGEYWIGGQPGQYRGTGLSTLLARHAFLSAMLRWNPDYFFGFMAKSLVMKGFSARFGYLHTEPNAIRYVLNGRDDVLDGLMGYNSNEDLRFILDVPVSEFMAQAA